MLHPYTRRACMCPRFIRQSRRQSHFVLNLIIIIQNSINNIIVFSIQENYQNSLNNTSGTLLLLPLPLKSNSMVKCGVTATRESELKNFTWQSLEELSLNRSMYCGCVGEVHLCIGWHSYDTEQTFTYTIQLCLQWCVPFCCVVVVAVDFIVRWSFESANFAKR